MDYSYQIRLRRGTDAQWGLKNPILSDGEPAYVTDLNLYKIGDGVTPWNSLPYTTGPQGEAATITVGTVTTGGPGTDAEVTNVGDQYDAVFDFKIPMGPQGEQGPSGGSGGLSRTGKWLANVTPGATPSSQQITSDTGDLADGVSWVRFADMDENDIDQSGFILANIVSGSVIFLQQATDSTRWSRLIVNGDPVDNGSYVQIPVAFNSAGSGGGAWQSLLVDFVTSGSGGGGVTDHGGLTGLSDDDHPQYHTDARGDARYYTQAQVDGLLEGVGETALDDLTDVVAPAPSNGQVLTYTISGDAYPYSGTPDNDGIINALGGEAAQPNTLTLSSSSETSFRWMYYALNPLTNEYFQSTNAPNPWYIVEATDPNAEMLVTAVALRSPDNVNSFYGSLPIYVEGRTPGTSDWVTIGTITVDPGRANWSEAVVPVSPVLCEAIRFRKDTGASNTTLAFSSIEVWGTWSAAGLDPHWAPADAAGGVTDHGLLAGLGDDDHPQYMPKAGGTFTGSVDVPLGILSTSSLYVSNANDAMFEIQSNMDGVRFGSNRLQFVGTPTVGTDATTKDYVDTGLAGKSDAAHNHDGVYDPAGSASAAVSNHVSSNDPHAGEYWRMWTGTQAQYDAIGTKDPNFMYAIVE